MHAVLRRLRAHLPELAVTVGITALIITIGSLNPLKDTDTTSPIQGVRWLTVPLANFLKEGGIINLASVAACLGLLCGLLVAGMRVQLKATAAQRVRNQR
jgi:hypothetical protein